MLKAGQAIDARFLPEEQLDRVVDFLSASPFLARLHSALRDCWGNCLNASIHADHDLSRLQDAIVLRDCSSILRMFPDRIGVKMIDLDTKPSSRREHYLAELDQMRKKLDHTH